MTVSERDCTTVYNSIAADYDEKRFGTAHGRYDLEESRALLEDIIRGHIDRQQWSALDVAAGTGKVAITAAHCGGRVVALDSAEAMLWQCQWNAIRDGVAPRISCQLGRAEQLPFPANHFDLVFSFRFLHLVPRSEYPHLLREMLRVTKPGGHIVIEIKNRWYGLLWYSIRDRRRVRRGENRLSSYSSLRDLAHLAKEAGGCRLLSTYGLLLPKGWWLLGRPRLQWSARLLARKWLKPISAHVVAVYRKMD
ncbi:MAG: class I SAM-dependent methyltransferase [Terriglobales bacterium]